jgi:hypothetical protein
MSQIKNTSITSPCLNSFKEYVLKNIDNYPLTQKNVLEADAIPENRKDWNTPRAYKGRDINDARSFDWEVRIQDALKGSVKLCMYYDCGDFIGWHTNSAVTGYNLILTYSESTSSYFETENIKCYDILGWSYKCNSFTSKSFWHRAVAKGPRIVLGILFEAEQERSNAIKLLKTLNIRIL